MNLNFTQSALAELARRMPAGADTVPRLKALKAATGAAQLLVNTLAERKAALATDTALSPQGRRDKLREFAGKTVAADVARLGRVVDLTKAKLDTWQVRNEAFPPADKADAAGATRRAEYRALLRDMKNEGQKLDAALANPEVAAAILESADFASDINAQTRKNLVKVLIDRDPVRAAAAADIQQARDTLVILQESVNLARGAVAELGEFGPNEIAPFIADSVDAAEIERSAVRNVDSMAL